MGSSPIASTADQEWRSDVERDLMTGLPSVVSPEKWQSERDELLSLEKEATHALDAVSYTHLTLPTKRIV